MLSTTITTDLARSFQAANRNDLESNVQCYETATQVHVHLLKALMYLQSRFNFHHIGPYTGLNEKTFALFKSHLCGLGGKTCFDDLSRFHEKADTGSAPKPYLMYIISLYLGSGHNSSEISVSNVSA